MPRRLARFLLLSMAVGPLTASAPPGIWLDVPFVKQEKDGCGAASISMVLQYWNQQQKAELAAPADAHLIQQKLYSKPAKGIYASAMAGYFEQAGFHAFAFRGEWADLKNHLTKGRPLIVSLKEPGREDARHYVVVAGLDWERNLVFVNDPARQKLMGVSRTAFERSWGAAANWTLLALPKQDE